MPDDDAKTKEVRFTSQFIRSAYELPKEAARKVLKALYLFVTDPSHPSLHLERLSGEASGLFSIRVDDNLRIIMAYGATPVLLFAGTHDAAYRVARGGSRLFAASDDGVGYREDRLHEIDSEQEVLYDQIPRHRVTTPFSSRAWPSGSATLSVDDLDRLIVRTKKYLPLTEFLLNLPPSQSTIELTFEDIQQLIGAELPRSGRRYSAWWANDVTHTQASAWMAVGWKTSNVQLIRQCVTLERT